MGADATPPSRPRRLATSLLLMMVLAACGAGVGWEALIRDPGQSPMPEGVDPRDAPAMFLRGTELLEADRPREAAAAFYWASRLDPTWAEPLFARRIALFMTSPRKLHLYTRGVAEVVESPEVRQLDSLYLRGLYRNPFPLLRQDAVALDQLLEWLLEEELRQRYSGTPGVSARQRSDVATAKAMILRHAPLQVQAWLAYSRGHYEAAEVLYMSALQDPDLVDDPHLWADLARARFHGRRYREADAAMRTAIGIRSRPDPRRLVRVYGSLALMHHSLGVIRHKAGDFDGAREAYAAALQEDLSFHPAHVRLAGLALQAGDTVTALGEMRLAADVAPTSVAVRLEYGRFLGRLGDWTGAVDELRAAAALEPLFPAPRLELGRTYDALGRPAEALRWYRRFLELAPPRAHGVDEARERVSELSNAGAD